jgi:hypothetical protein
LLWGLSGSASFYGWKSQFSLRWSDEEKKLFLSDIEPRVTEADHA